MRGYGISLDSAFDTDPVPDWYYEDWFARGETIMTVTGDPGIGKTLLLLRLMFSMVTRANFFGRPYKGDTVPKFLYIDLDMGPLQLRRHTVNTAMSMGLDRDAVATLEDNIVLLCDGIEPDLPRGFSFRMDKDKVDGIDGGQLRKLMDKVEPDIVVLESWSNMCAGNTQMNDMGETQEAFTYLRSQGNPETCWWVVHHNAKSTHDAGGRRIAAQKRGGGSMMFNKNADRGFDLCEVGKPGPGGKRVMLEWSKMRNYDMPAHLEYTMGRDKDGLFRMDFQQEVT